LLANVDSLMGQVAHGKGLALRVEPPALPPGQLRGDGLRIEQILLNLVGNAIKFTERGEVAVRVRADELTDASLRLHAEVRDTGIGIAADALARLFTPFTQADAGVSRRFGGTGLGLSICKRLVELMGGTIGAESEPGLGSRFWFELPLERVAAADAVPALPVAMAKATGPRLSGAHVLVVDDSAMNRDLVERALALEGATATLAADGRQALERLKGGAQAFDAVLMDVQMPVLDGLSATRSIRGELGLSALPVIAFTAGVRAEQQAAARAAGADDVLPKPMDLEQLTQVLLRWIGPRQPAEEVALAAAGDDFPTLPGIDRARAMQRLGKDRGMFLGLLEMFIEDNAGVVAQTRADLARGDGDGAARRMHTLRSNAGFICALEIMEAADALEHAIERGEPGVHTALDGLEEGILAIVSAARALS
jgi:CheY-like chemotaxis protein/HPt (histidine-containing phosphotransfer) domain-containing protein